MHPVALKAAVAVGPFALSLLAGCGMGPTFERRVTVEFAPASDAILGVKSSNGGISVGPATGESVVVNARIRARSQERADSTQIVAALSQDGAYVIEAVWPTPRMSNEGCSFEVSTPPVSGVDIDTSNGAITLTGLSGSARLDTSNGAIKVNGFDGRIDAETSNGPITIIGASSSVSADSSNGPISVELTDGAMGPVTIQTSNGSISLVIGEGFVGTVVGDTSNGSVSFVTPRAASVSTSKGRGSASFGQGGASSELKSSNGSITVRSR